MTKARIARREFLRAAGSAAGVYGLLASVQAIAAEGPALTVSPVRRVGPAGTKHFEPWIAANPRDASNLVILGSRFLGKTKSKLRTEPAAWFTTDGGVTWSAGEFVGAAALRGERSDFGNAHATFASDGTAFCVYCGSPEGDRLDLRVFRSDDGGRHWLGPTKLEGNLDYPRIAVELDAADPRVFIVAGVEGNSLIFGDAKRSGYGCVVLRSDDGAKTFSVVNFLAPTTLHHDPNDSPIVLPDGRLLVGINDYPSADTVDEPREAIEHVRIYTTASRDGGATFSPPAPIGEARRWDGWMAIAADRSSGPRRGRVYAVGHSQTSNPPGLRLHASNDGVSWTHPTVVPGLPPGSIAYATIAVSSRGVVGLAWIQAEPGDPVRPNEKECTAREHAWKMFVAASADGGKTFTAPAPIFQEAYRTDPTIWRWPYGAEYVSLAASPDGRFHLVWVDTRDGRGEIQAAHIDVN